MSINRYTIMAVLAATMIILGAMTVDGSSLRCIVYSDGIEMKARIGFILGITTVAVGGGIMATAIILEANRD